MRYLGVGAMLAGGIVTLWRLRTPIGRALARASAWCARADGGVGARGPDLSTDGDGERVGLAMPVIFAMCMVLSGSMLLSVAMAVVLAIVGFFATAMAGYLTGIVGASNNPVSGVTVIVLLAIALVLKLLGVRRASAHTSRSWPVR